ncbi:protein-glutamine gamma-glutamyltransferase [Paenibacillus sp. y28]|uniref:protein-glutamine gamma-glutamyltransferase n=1 Tax=Paenibacillus sp. y28 TaxID=3129110 RepID=UPI003017A6F5
MIAVAGTTLGSDFLAQFDGIERKILNTLAASPITYRYDSTQDLLFELKLREEIIQASRDLYESRVSFATFEKSRCNTYYWQRTSDGGFKLRPGVRPSDAIRDIYRNGESYGFECATAMLIVIYKAVLESIDDAKFDELFGGLFLHDWQSDEDLGLTTTNPRDTLPGDARYFKNPDVRPSEMEWQGENVIDMGDGTYYGHGIGIKNKAGIIEELNRHRKRGSTRSAYLLGQATRPDFAYLAGFSDENMNQSGLREFISSHPVSHWQPEIFARIGGYSYFG